MRAWRVDEVGPPDEVLRLAEHQSPEPRPGQVLLEVELASLNFADDLMIRGRYQVKPQPPFTPGIEVLGRVVTSGPGANLTLGTRGVAMTDPSAGSFAELALAEAGDLFEVPDR